MKKHTLLMASFMSISAMAMEDLHPANVPAISLNYSSCFISSNETVADEDKHRKTMTVKQLMNEVTSGYVTTLDFTLSNITDEVLVRVVKECRGLKKLILSSTLHVTRVGLAAVVTSYPDLEKLDLSGCSNLTDNDVEPLKALKNLCSVVDITGCYEISPYFLGL